MTELCGLADGSVNFEDFTTYDWVLDSGGLKVAQVLSRLNQGQAVAVGADAVAEDVLRSGNPDSEGGYDVLDARWNSNRIDGLMTVRSVGVGGDTVEETYTFTVTRR